MSSALLKQRTLDADQAFLDRLRALRDSQQSDPDVRILAGKLLASQGQTGSGDDEYISVQRALASPGTHDWSQLRAFALRLLEFPAKRAEAAEFLTSLVKNATKPQDVRIAAYSVFEDPRLFQPDNLDAVSTLIFDTVQGMLRSPEVFLRQAGAMLLHNLARKASQRSRTDFMSRARAAITSALAAEADAGTQQIMKRTLDLLAKAPERG